MASNIFEYLMNMQVDRLFWVAIYENEPSIQTQKQFFFANFLRCFSPICFFF